MQKMIEALSVAFISLLLASCGGLPYDKTQTPQQAANDIRLTQTITHHAACEYGRTSAGYTDTYFYPCIYIGTESSLSLLDFDRNTKKYIEVVRILYADAPEIALAHNFAGEQLQIKAKSTYLLINISSVNASIKINQLYEYLISRGFKVGNGIGYVNARPHNVSPTPVTIPIYIPAGK